MLLPRNLSRVQTIRGHSTSHPRLKIASAILLCTAIIVMAGTTAISYTKKGDAPPIPFQDFSLKSKDERGLQGHKIQQIYESLTDEVLYDPLLLGSLQTTMLLGIFSTSGQKYAKRRSLVRETYLAVKDPRLCRLSEYKRQVEERPRNVVCQLPYAFIIGAGGHGRPFDHDDEESLTIPEADLDSSIVVEEDCIYLNIKENMEDGKSSTYFKFGADLSRSFDIDYIAKIDDDSVLAVDALLDMLNHDLPPSPYNRRHYGGAPWGSWGKDLMYGAGQFYFMSSDLANYVGNILSAKQRLSLMHSRHTEDGDMGAFVFSHPRPIKFISLASFTFWHHPRKDRASFLDSWENGMGGLPRACVYGANLPLEALCSVWLGNGGL